MKKGLRHSAWIIFTILLLVNIMPLSIVYAAYSLDDGFDSGDFSGGWTSQNGNPKVQNVVVLAGTHSMRAEITADVGANTTMYDFGSTQAEVWAQCNFTLNAVNTQLRNIIGMTDDYGNEIGGIGVDAGSNQLLLRWFNGASVQSLTSSTTISLDTEYEIELYIKIHDTEGEFDVWLNDVNVTDLHKQGIDNKGSVDLDDVIFGIGYGWATTRIYIDDCIIDTTEHIDINPPGGGAPPDSTPPTWVKNRDMNLTRYALAVMGFNVTLKDETGLGDAILSYDDGSGVWQNNTKKATGGGISYSFHDKFSLVPGTIGKVKVRFNDTSGNAAWTDPYVFNINNSTTFTAFNNSIVNIQEAIDAAEVAAVSSDVYVELLNYTVEYASNADGTLLSIDVPTSYGFKVYGQGMEYTKLSLATNITAENTMFFDVQGKVGGTVHYGRIQFSGIKMSGRGPYISAPSADSGVRLQSCKNFRVFDCNFTMMGSSGVYVYDGDNTYGTAGGDWTDVSYGVVDHCRFYNIYKPNCTLQGRGYGYGVSMSRAYHRLWNTNLFPAGNVSKQNDPFGIRDDWDIGRYGWSTFGNYVYNVVVENCYFWNPRHAIQSVWGGAWVGRYNTILDVGVHDSISTGHPVRTDTLGSLACEFYNNFVNDTGYFDGVSFLGPHIEGGSGLIYNNWLENLSNWLSVGSCEDAGNPEYPLGAMNNTYTWNNTIIDCGTVYVNDNSGLGGDGPPVNNTDYFINTEPPENLHYVALSYPHSSVSGAPMSNNHTLMFSDPTEETDGFFNFTVFDSKDGAGNLKNATIQIETHGDAETVVLKLDFITGTFSEHSDASNIFTLNAGRCLNNTRETIFSDIMFCGKFSSGATEGSLDAVITVYDKEGNKDSRTYDNVITLNAGAGWTGTVNTVSNPIRILGVVVTNINLVNEVP